ncbi:MAG: Ig-like domain-containing protein [Verrucomicrobiota bacterium]
MNRLKTLVVLVGAMLPLPFCSIAHAQDYGLSSRPDVGAYLDGALPPTPPAVSANWTTVVAFPNLHFDNAMGLLPMPGTNKLVVWEREGRIYQFENSAATADSGKTLMLNLSNQCQGWDDLGMMGIAFHPDFETNRHVYVFYCWVPPGTVVGSPTTRPPNGTANRTRLSRFTVGANGVADPASETVIIDQSTYNTWHKGGGMFFHPGNGFLYLTFGNDNNASNDQKITGGFFGCVARIDVDKRGGSISHAPVKRAFEEVSPNWPQYFVPNDNPFVGVANALEEIYSLGLRSPHRMTVDPVTQRVFIADVGGGSREEVSVIEPTDPGGLNFQWNTIEGYNGDLTGNYAGVNKRPILDYSRGDGVTVIGGYVYRGSEFPELAGKYLFADNSNRRIWYMDESAHTATTPATKVLMATVPRGPGPNSGSDYLGISSWGHDANNELYLCQLGTGTTAANDGGQIYKLQRGGAPSTPLPATLSQTGAFSDLPNLVPSSKLIPYSLNAPFWSDGAVKSRWAVIPNSTTVGFAATGDWEFPGGSVLVKHFELPVDDTNPAVRKRLETRLLVKMANGGSYGATYKWRPDNSDADLMDAGLTENIPIAIQPIGTLTGANLGTPATNGSLVRSGDAVTLTAGGTDIWGNADQGYFASQQRSGDFDISIRVESLTQPDFYSKIGLMVRESPAANSRHVYAMVFPSNGSRNNNVGGYEFQYRTNTGGPSAAIYPAVPQPLISYPNGWLRLKREGDTFVSYSGTDGVNWKEFARLTLDLPESVYFGLAATAHTASPAATAKIWLQSTRLQPWYFPSRNDCTSCHTPGAGGGVLGLSTRQLNKPQLFPGTGITDNQLRAWAHVGLFDSPPPEASLSSLDTLAAIEDTSASLEKRSRSYFDSNCSYCHRPGGVQAFWDARYDTPLTQQGIVYGPVGSDLGIPGARVVTPQDLAHSILYQRVNRVGANQMPPIARNQIDTVAVDVLKAWIESIQPAPAPVVSLTEPADGSTIVRAADVPMAATATAADGISKVEFHQGATLLGTTTTPPYTFVWSRPPQGDFPLTATAYGIYGNSARSVPVMVHLQNPPATFERKVNFEIASTATPAGYLKDTGAVYSAGRGYGWSRDNTVDARQRATPADLRYATLIHLQKVRDNIGTSFWEMDVPNGYYDVRIVAGDSDFTDGDMHLTAEGVTITSGQPVANWIDRTGSVTVSDGKLTIAPGPDAVNSKISFIEINRITVPPSVALSGMPANPAYLNTDSITLTASAADSDGNVSRVEFWNGNVKLGEDSTPPYSWSWGGPLAPGNHILKTVAYDNDGRATTSASVSVNVMPLKLDFTGFANNGAPLLQTQIPAGRNYTVFYTDDLEHWHPLESDTADGTVLDIQDPDTGEKKRFYQLKVEP